MPLVSESLHLIWPARCAACDETDPRGGAVLRAVQPGAQPALRRLPGLRAAAARRSARAGVRRQALRALPARAVAVHDRAAPASSTARPSRDAIVRMKHGKRRELARRLARLLVPSLADLLARARLRAGRRGRAGAAAHRASCATRGFNQALELARFALIGLARAPELKPRARAAAPGAQPPASHARDALAGPRQPGGALRGGGGRVRRQRDARACATGASLRRRRRLHDRRDVQRVQRRAGQRRRRRRPRPRPRPRGVSVSRLLSAAITASTRSK